MNDLSIDLHSGHLDHVAVDLWIGNERAVCRNVGKGISVSKFWTYSREAMKSIASQ